MFDPNYARVLYQDSPFLPQVNIQAIWQVYDLIAQGYYCVPAIASEMRVLSSYQKLIIASEAEWISENFPIDQENAENYYLGTMVPPTLILAAALSNEEISLKQVLTDLFPVHETSVIKSFKDYLIININEARKMYSPNTLPSAIEKPLYEHCKFNVITGDPWYLIGIESSRLVFSKLSKLFEDS